MITTRTMLLVCGSMSVALTCAGCATVRNERLVDGPIGAPTTYQPPALWPAEALTPAAGPSTTTLDRSHWQPVTIVAVNDGVEHQETLTRYWPSLDRATARSRGEFPTVATCVETGGNPGAQVAEGFAWPVAICSDIVMGIPRMVHQVNQSPTRRYEREAAAPAPAEPASAE